MKSITLLILLLCTTQVHAVDIEASSAHTLNTQQGPSIFHHLESGGRRSIATSNNNVAVVWEDNSSGSNSVYYVHKKITADNFSKPVNLSANTTAYSPVISAFKQGFIVAWEQQDSTRVLYIDPHGKILSAINLGNDQERQVSFHSSNDDLLAAWIIGDFHGSDIVTATISTDAKNSLQLNKLKKIDVDSPKTLKAYPSIVKTRDSFIISWQDLRTGTNVIRYIRSTGNNTHSEQKNINETIKKSDKYGRGSGVMRASLSRINTDSIIAVWMDKRARKSGYEVFASISDDEGKSFGENIKVQDTFGDQLPQWNANVVSNGSGKYIVLWNDSREGTQDICYSYMDEGEWSDDIMIDIASGAGDQYAASAVFDNDGNIHLAWLNKEDDETSVKYAILKTE